MSDYTDADLDLLGVGLPAIDSQPYYMTAGDGEFPPLQTPTYYPTNTPSIALSTGANNRNSDSGSFLEKISATGESLVKLWGAGQQLSLARDQMSLDRMRAEGAISVAQANAQSSRDIAVTQANTAAELERLRAGAAVAQQQRITEAAKNGTVVIPGASGASVSPTMLLGLVALVFVGVSLMGGKKGAAK